MYLYQSSKITLYLSASKPRGSIDRKSVHIPNIDRLATPEPRELVLQLKYKLFSRIGIISCDWYKY